MLHHDVLSALLKNTKYFHWKEGYSSFVFFALFTKLVLYADVLEATMPVALSCVQFVSSTVRNLKSMQVSTVRILIT